MEPGSGVLVAEGQRVRVGVGTLVDAEHACHVPGAEHHGPPTVAQRDRARKVHRGHTGACLGVGRAHLRRHGLHRHRPGVRPAAHDTGRDGALEGDGVGRRAVLGRHDRDAVAARQRSRGARRAAARRRPRARPRGPAGRRPRRRAPWAPRPPRRRAATPRAPKGNLCRPRARAACAVAVVSTLMPSCARVSVSGSSAPSGAAPSTTRGTRSRASVSPAASAVWPPTARPATVTPSPIRSRITSCSVTNPAANTRRISAAVAGHTWRRYHAAKRCGGPARRARGALGAAEGASGAAVIRSSMHTHCTARVRGGRAASCTTPRPPRSAPTRCCRG